MAASKFQFYEIVRVSDRHTNNNLINRVGAIIGMSENEVGTWHYSVSFSNLETCWMVPEDNLISTGIFETRETFYDGTSITVEVDPITGEGRLKE